jgi:hypothetical protein
MGDYRSCWSFVADAPGLDFVNAVAPPIHRDLKPLVTGEDLLNWLKEAKLVPQRELDDIRLRCVLGELDAVASRAKMVAQSFRTFVHLYKGRPLPAEAANELRFLNEILARDSRFGQISIDWDSDDPRMSGLVWSTRRHWRAPEALLFPIAEAMADLICDEDFSHIRKCDAPECSLLFLDRTRSRTRRSCGMTICRDRVATCTSAIRHDGAGRGGNGTDKRR